MVKHLSMKGLINSITNLAGAGFLLFLFAVWQTEPAPSTDSVTDTGNTELPPPPTVLSPRLPPQPENWLEKLKSRLSSPCDGQSREIYRSCNHLEMRQRVFDVIHPANNGSFNLGVVCDVYDYLHEKWQYRPDPLREELFALATDSWDMCAGDCDDFAIAMAAALQSVGGYPRIVLAGFEGGDGHAYCEINLGAMPSEVMEDYLHSRYEIRPGKALYFRYDLLGNLYLNLDWGEPHPGAGYADSYFEVALYPVGKRCEELL